MTVPQCNHKTNAPVLKNDRKSFSTQASGAIEATTSSMVGLQIRQSSREFCNWL